MLRIHFTAADIARVRIAPSPDPLWEIVLSLHVLQTRQQPARFAEFRAKARSQVLNHDLATRIKHLLFPLTPVASYFPDFLTPEAAIDGLDAGIDAVARTPQRQMREELARMASRTSVPGWTRALANGDRDLRTSLATALRSYHDAVLAPLMSAISNCLAADRAIRIRTLRDGGVEGLLRGLWPIARWQSSTLVAAYPADLDVHPGGRGLVLIPSYFCSRMPVALVDPEMQPVFVYPAANSAAASWADAKGCSDGALANLLGPTRAAVLLAIGDGCATKRLPTRLDVSPATISHHTGVLREAGLIVTQRVANTVVHSLTPLGARLIGRPLPPD